MSDGPQKSILLSISVSSGSGTGTVPSEWVLSRRIRVIPPSDGSVYSLNVKDGAGDSVWRRDSQQGFLSEEETLSLGICATVAISSASQDGTYKVRFDLH